MLRFMAPLWPDNLFYLVQSNVAGLVLAWSGSATDIAQLGALSRLMQIVGVFLTVVNHTIVLPYVSRGGSVKHLRRRGMICLSLLGSAVLSALALTWAFPVPFLLVLGPSYDALRA